MRGVTIAIFLLCLSVFGTFMAAPGSINDTLGIGSSTGLEEPASDVGEDFQGEQRPSERGGATGILGFAVYAMKALGNFFTLFTSIATVLNTLSGGRFTVLWNGIQLIVVVIGTLMLIWIARGVIGE